MEHHTLTSEQEKFILKVLKDSGTNNWHDRYVLTENQIGMLELSVFTGVYDDDDKKLLNRIGEWYGKRKPVRRSKVK